MKLERSESIISDCLIDRDKINPIFENSGEGKSFIGNSTISSGLNFGKFESTIGIKDLNIKFLPTNNPYNGIIYNGLNIPIFLNNIVKGNHRINVVKGNVKFHILEHVLSISSALGINFNLEVNGANSWPSLSEGINCFSSVLKYSDKSKLDNLKYYTVNKPIKINFNNKIGSYIILLPDEGDRKIIFDMMINYPGKSIGKQRIITEINDDIYLNSISKSRTNAFGIREKLLQILDKIPCIKKISYNFDLNNVFAFNESELINPKNEFFTNSGDYTELMFHSVMDILGSLGIDISLGKENGYKFVGKIITFANSHDDDLEMLNLIQNGDIGIKKIYKN